MRLGFLIYLFVLICAFPDGIYAQTGQPTSLCADVAANGEVILSWEYPGANAATVYDIYRDQGLGFMGPVVSVNFPDLSYSDVGAGADQNSIRYYVTARDAPAGAVADTVSTIFLELIPTGTSLVAQLEWNSPFDPMPIGGEFVIERSQEGEAFIEVSTVPPTQNLFLDTLYSVCELTEFIYRIRYVRDACSMSSQEVLGEFEDDEGPPAAVVETISVDPVTGQVTIYWFASPAPDIAGYVIQDVDVANNQYEELDSLPGTSLSYSLDLSASNEPVTWVVRAKDTCGTDESFARIHTTMEVEATYSDCQDFVTVNWTPYSEEVEEFEAGWPEGVDSYEIRAILEDGTDTLLTTEGPDGFITNVDIEPNTQYRIYVKAISNGNQRPSTSNGVVIFTEYPPLVEFFYQSSVSTNLQGEIEATLYQDGEGVGTTYELYRAEETGNFNLIATISSVPGEDTIRYVDWNVRANELVYTYYWTAIDGCGEVIGDSNESSNMVLESRTNPNDLINRLSWTPYEGWDGNVVEYQILRAQGDEDPMFYDSTAPFETEWSEDVEPFLMTEGRFCYRIMAVESTNEFGPGAVAFSNLSCATQEPLIWIPSAMVYDGFNDEFKPVLGFVDFDSYRMEIYNKWGELLFETSDIEQGWDGTYQGNVVPEEYYRYIVTVRDGAGKPFIEEDVLYMVRNAE